MRSTALLLSLGTLLLGACATMDADECRTVDWRTVGYEDGVAGQPGDRIGTYRRDCAEHGVTPDAACTASRLTKIPVPGVRNRRDPGYEPDDVTLTQKTWQRGVTHLRRVARTCPLHALAEGLTGCLIGDAGVERL